MSRKNYKPNTIEGLSMTIKPHIPTFVGEIHQASDRRYIVDSHGSLRVLDYGKDHWMKDKISE